MSEPRKRDADRTRRALLAAAQQVFAEKGFDAARVDEIAAGADCNKGLIYLYFGSKENLFKEVLENNLRRLLDSSRQLIHAHEDHRAIMVNVLRHYFTFLGENPEFVRLLGWANLFYTGAAHAELTALLAQGLENMIAALEDGVRQGVFRADIDLKLLVASLIGLCLTFFQRRLLMAALWDEDLGDPAVRETVLRHLEILLFDGILARPGSRVREARGKR